MTPLLQAPEPDDRPWESDEPEWEDNDTSDLSPEEDPPREPPKKRGRKSAENSAALKEFEKKRRRG